MSCCNKTSCESKGKMNADAEPTGLVGLLTGPRRWWLFGVVGVIAGLTFGWEQLMLFGIAPILISLLPCLVMCGLGLCMMKCKSKSDPVDTGVEQPANMSDAQATAPQPETSGISGSIKAL